MKLPARIVQPANSAEPRWLVWLHGLLGSRSEWEEVIARLPGYAHLLIDLPGHGKALPPGKARFAEINQWLSDTLASEGIDQYWLVGYSLGGRLAMYHACHETQGALRGLIVEGGHPGLEDDARRHERLQADRRWAQRFRSEPLQQVLADWYLQPVFASLSPSQREMFIRLRSRHHPLALAAMLEASSLAHQPNLRPALAQLRIPFHYLFGEHDPKFRMVAEQLPATRHLITAAGHNAHRENPGAVANCLADILTHW